MMFLMNNISFSQMIDYLSYILAITHVYSIFDVLFEFLFNLKGIKSTFFTKKHSVYLGMLFDMNSYFAMSLIISITLSRDCSLLYSLICSFINGAYSFNWISSCFNVSCVKFSSSRIRA